MHLLNVLVKAFSLYPGPVTWKGHIYQATNVTPDYGWRLTQSASWYPLVVNWFLHVKCNSRLWHGNLITTAEILLMLMDFSVLAEDLDMVMLRTSAANGNMYFFAGVFCWLDGYLRLELTVGWLHRLKALVTWGRLLCHLSYLRKNHGKPKLV